MARIGFIGLGNMGGPMGANLVKAGHAVTGTDVSAAARDAFAAAGGTAVETLEPVVREAEIVVTMLPAGGHVREVVGRILDHAAAGTLLVDCSTARRSTSPPPEPWLPTPSAPGSTWWTRRCPAGWPARRPAR